MPCATSASFEVLTAEHFELREALPSEAETQMIRAKMEAEAVARLRDLALVSIDDAESPPFDDAERICSAAKAAELHQLDDGALRLILGDLATRNAAIAREESGPSESVPTAEGMRPVQARPSGNEGEYFLVAGESANSNPLWKQMGGKFWLYSGTNGLWIIGGGGAKRKNFECARGVIYSPGRLRNCEGLMKDGKALKP
eukprot:Skav221957  [mRNA]  locus=scaffold195:657655:668736:- [translate_table: standard]